MTKTRNALAAFGLAGVLLAAGASPVAAQDAGAKTTPEASKAPTFTFEGAQGDEASAADPAVAPTGGAQAAPQAPLVPVSEEEAKARADEVGSNYDETLDIYHQILTRNETDTSMIERRIQTNEELLERYGPRLSQSEQSLRITQVAFLNRILALKRQRDREEITKERFRELVEQDRTRYERRKARLKDDVDFYRGESKDARARLKTLGDQRSAKDRVRAVQAAQQPKSKDPNIQVVDEVLGVIDQLGGFHVRFTMDGVAGLRRYDHLHRAR